MYPKSLKWCSAPYIRAINPIFGVNVAKVYVNLPWKFQTLWQNNLKARQVWMMVHENKFAENAVQVGKWNFSTLMMYRVTVKWPMHLIFGTNLPKGLEYHLTSFWPGLIFWVSCILASLWNMPVQETFAPKKCNVDGAYSRASFSRPIHPIKLIFACQAHEG